MDLSERFTRQLAFVKELDKLKTIFRRTYLLDGRRTENDAEHSWQIALMALVLIEYAEEPGLDPLKTLSMLLIHDLVEIDAGDTYMYDPEAKKTQAAREEQAAGRVFGLLPNDERDRFLALWREFEEGRTAEAKFARAIDRLQPFLHNFWTQGRAWKEHGVRAESVRKVMTAVRPGSPRLWEFVDDIIDQAVEKGYLAV
ncbi:MAG TPA: HD domain-containing protein [Spirochaetia bacterium]|nr:HD domain-containing protein [Spirochaetia bacterium]